MGHVQQAGRAREAAGLDDQAELAQPICFHMEHIIEKMSLFFN